MKKFIFCILICTFVLFSCDNNPSHTHNWDNGAVTKEATCSSVGEKIFKCECGATKTEEIAINPNNHKVESYTTVVESTFLESGEDKGLCSLCNKEVVRLTEAKSLVGTVWKGSLYAGVMDAYLSFKSDESLMIVATSQENISNKIYITMSQKVGSYTKDNSIVKTTIEEEEANIEIKKDEQGEIFLNLTDGMYSIVLYLTEEEIPNKHSFTQPFNTGNPYWHALLCTDTHDHGEGIDGVLLTEIPHVVTSWHAQQPSNCSNEGYDEGTCTVCGGTAQRKLPLGDHLYNRIITQEATFFDKGKYQDVCIYCNDTIEGDFYKELKGSYLKLVNTHYRKENEGNFVIDGGTTGYALFLESGKAIISFFEEIDGENKLTCYVWDGYDIDREKMKLTLKMGTVSRDISIDKTEQGFKYTEEDNGYSKTVFEFNDYPGISITYKEYSEDDNYHWVNVTDRGVDYPLYLKSIIDETESPYILGHEYVDGRCKGCGHTQI